jgi:hypothetical protein
MINPDNMILILSWLPNIYMALVGILVCWGSSILVGLNMIIHHAHSTEPNRVRVHDKINTSIIKIILLFNILSFILVPKFLMSTVDILLVVNLWIGVYYTYVTVTSLKNFPRLYFIKQLRQERRADGDAYILR